MLNKFDSNMHFFLFFRRRVTVRCQSLRAQSPMDKGLDLQNNPLFWGHRSCQWSNERAQSDWLSWKISRILLLSLGIYFCMSNWNSGLQWSHRRVQVILFFFCFVLLVLREYIRVSSRFKFRFGHPNWNTTTYNHLTISYLICSLISDF